MGAKLKGPVIQCKTPLILTERRDKRLYIAGLRAYSAILALILALGPPDGSLNLWSAELAHNSLHL